MMTRTVIVRGNLRVLPVPRHGDEAGDDRVLDRDSQGFFEALAQHLVLKAGSNHTQGKWTLLSMERWLKADGILAGGERAQRTKGTPPGGVISPLLANIVRHWVFDKWRQKEFSCLQFESYADDIVVPCRRLEQVEFIARKIRHRLSHCGLELCQEKTQIVYGQDTNRKGTYPNQSFDFLGYTFRPGSGRDRPGKFFVSCSPAVSRKALKAMRLKIKEQPLIKGGFSQDIVEIARAINPIIQGWINYYGKFRKSSMSAIYDDINEKLINWARRKYKHLQRRKWRAGQGLRGLYLQNPALFAHWRGWGWVAE